jgi:cysteine desulfurase
MSLIYFDNNSTMKAYPQAIEAFNMAANESLNNLSIHQLGRKAENIVENARQEISHFLNANNFEVIFTSSATEASNMAIFGLNVKSIIISKIEHAALYNCRPFGKNILEFGVDKNGVFDLVELQNIINRQENGNFLVVAMLANNETGTIQPVKEIAKMVHQKGGLILCDIVQAIGKIEVDLEDLNIDLATISSHKIGGLQGVGALLLKKGIEVKPFIFGGGQERNKRAGTVNVSGVAAFGAACKIKKTKNDSMNYYYDKVKELRDYLEYQITRIANDDVVIFGKKSLRLPNTSFFATNNCLTQTQIIQFDLNNICVSGGATCSSGSLKESRVLKAMKINNNIAGCAIRISLREDNSLEEIDQFIDIWQKIYKKQNLK